MQNPLFLAATQETTDGGRTWETVGAIEVVDTPRPATAAEVAFAFAAENAQDSPDVRVAVWANPDEETDLAAPDVKITHRDLVGTGNTKRRASRKNRGPRPRTNGPVGEVVCKRAANKDLFKQYVLVTNDPGNRAGRDEIPGADWYPAERTDGAVRAFVTGTGEMTFQGKEVFSLHFALGEARMLVGTPVIVDRDASRSPR